MEEPPIFEGTPNCSEEFAAIDKELRDIQLLAQEYRSAVVQATRQNEVYNRKRKKTSLIMKLVYIVVGLLILVLLNPTFGVVGVVLVVLIGFYFKDAFKYNTPESYYALFKKYC